MFEYQYPDATNEQKLEQLRLWRNNELTATDWTQLQDAPVDQTAWAEYRQALRDLPDNVDLDNPTIPLRPS
jgi:hypothetical protein